MKKVKIVREFEKKRGLSVKSQGTLTGCLNLKVLTLLRVKWMISVSTKMPYQEVREKPGKKKVGKLAIPLESMTNGQINNVLSPLKHSWVFRCQSICQGLISNS